MCTVRAGLMQGQRVTQETASTASLASFLASAKRQEPFDCDKQIGTPKVPTGLSACRGAVIPQLTRLPSPTCLGAASGAGLPGGGVQLGMSATEAVLWPCSAQEGQSVQPPGASRRL